MKRLSPYLFSLFVFTLFFLGAKSAEKGVIRGKVVEEVGGLPIPFAIIAVYESTAEQPLFTTQSDEIEID